jgi:hypothetical protein
MGVPQVKMILLERGRFRAHSGIDFRCARLEIACRRLINL